MPRAMWKGTLSFGLVSVPISLSPAVRSQDIHFHMVHDADGGRIRQKRVCEKDGKEVPYEHIVKAYEVSKHNYVTITKEELKAADPERDKLVHIESFVDLEEIDPVFYENSYYVQPDGKGAEKAYGLLVAALSEMNKAAVARIVLSTALHLCIVRAKDDGLMLTTLSWADEVAEAPEHKKPHASEGELKMAKTLIEQMASKFEPSKFKDDHREKVIEMLEAKAKGKTFKAEEGEERPHITDLQEALERSLAAAQSTSKMAPSAARRSDESERGSRKPARAHRRHAPARSATAARARRGKRKTKK